MKECCENSWIKRKGKLIKKQGSPHIGLYCAECDKWIKWVRGMDTHLYMQKIEIRGE